MNYICEDLEPTVSHLTVSTYQSPACSGIPTKKTYGLTDTCIDIVGNGIKMSCNNSIAISTQYKSNTCSGTVASVTDLPVGQCVPSSEITEPGYYDFSQCIGGSTTGQTSSASIGVVVSFVSLLTFIFNAI